MKGIIPVLELAALREENQRSPDERVTALLSHIEAIEDFVARLMADYLRARKGTPMITDGLRGMDTLDLASLILDKSSDAQAKRTWLPGAARLLCERDIDERANFDNLKDDERELVSRAIDAGVPPGTQFPRAGYRLTVCFGEAHENIFTDHCLLCAPRWGWCEVPASCLTVFEAHRRGLDGAATGAQAP